MQPRLARFDFDPEEALDPTARTVGQVRVRFLIPLGLLATYIALAFLVSAHTWAHPFSRSMGFGADPPQFMWFLGWGGYAIRHGANPFFSDYLDYPAGVNLLWNCSLPLVSAVMTPLTSTLGVIFSYNLMMTLALALSAWTAFLLIRRIVPATLAAAVGGLLYGFSPAMIAQSLAHPHISVAFVPPLIFLALAELLIRQRHSPITGGLILGLLAVAQLLIGEEMLVGCALVSLFAVLLLAAYNPDQVRVRLPHLLKGLGVAAITFGVLAAFPIYFQFGGPQHLLGLVHPPGEYVTDPWNFIIPDGLQQLSPGWAIRMASQWTGNIGEWGGYIGIPLLVLLGITTVAFWKQLSVRLAFLTAAAVCVLSLGVTVHNNGQATRLPVAFLAVLFLPLSRGPLGRLIVYLVAVTSVVLASAPVLGHLLPARLMIYAFLFIGVLVAVFIDAIPQFKGWQKLIALPGLAIALLPLVPVIPYPDMPITVPAFFRQDTVKRIPQGSDALIVPMSDITGSDAMLWQAVSQMRFKMPEGYVFIPAPLPAGNRLSPPDSGTYDTLRAIEDGSLSGVPAADVQSEIRKDLSSWNVQTIVVGPMPHEQVAVDLFTALLGRSPEYVGGVYVWWQT